MRVTATHVTAKEWALASSALARYERWLRQAWYNSNSYPTWLQISKRSRQSPALSMASKRISRPTAASDPILGFAARAAPDAYAGKYDRMTPPPNTRSPS